MRLQFVLGELANGLRRNLSMTVSVVLVTAVSLFFLGFGLLSHYQVETMKDYWYDRVEVSIFLCGQDSSAASCASGEVSPLQRTALESQLQSLRPLVQSVYYESKSEAWKRFKEQFKDSAIVDNLSESQMPESFRVKLSDPKRFAVVASAFEGAPGVDYVQDQRTLLDRFFSLLNKMSLMAWSLAALMLVCAVLLVATTIRLSAFSRRRETGIMRLVGASNLLIQLPFILETVVAALLGAGLAAGFLWGVVHFFVQGVLAPGLPFTRFIDTSHVLLALPWLLATGVGLAVMASFLTLRRYLRV